MSGKNTSGTGALERRVGILGVLALLFAIVAANWWDSKSQVAKPALHPAVPAQANTEAEPVETTAGRVRVHVVDVHDGSALPDIEVELIAEEPLRKSFGRVRTDAHGDAQFEAVFAPLVLVFSRRSERFAQALTIAHGELASTRDALLRLGSGGQISGRVTDDTGAPVAGARVTLADVSGWLNSDLPAVVAASTAADGSYQIQRVVNLPRLITARQGSFFAAASSQVILEVSGLGGIARSAISVLPCDEVIAPDIMLPRPPTFAGRVLDAARQPVAGALVSVNAERQRLTQFNLHVVDPKAFEAGMADLPGMARFALRPGEALTASDGSFELVGAPQRSSALVALADGRMEESPLLAWKPGARVEALEFVLAQREVLRMRLFDTDDRPIFGEAPELQGGAASADDFPGLRLWPVGGVLLSAWTNSKVDLLAELSDGRELRVQAAPAGDGSFSFALPGALSSIERLSLSAPGYKTLVREVRGRLRVEPAVASEHLERLATLELELELSDNFENPPGSESQLVQIRSCALPPEPVVSDPAHPRPACCGFGMFAQLSLQGGKQHVALPLLSEQPMWLTIRSSRGRRSEEFVAGPFTADGTVQSIEVESLPPGVSAFDRPLATESRRNPDADRGHQAASLCVFDAKHHVPIGAASVWAVCDPLGRETLLGRSWTTDASGRAALDDLALGSWTFVVSAAGHQIGIIGPLEIAATGADEAPIDLGEVQLSPVN